MGILGRHKVKLIIAIPILIYFIWGYFGFTCTWIPGEYDTETKTYKVFWYQEGFACRNGHFRIKAYTPFKKHGLCDTSGRLVIPFRYDKIGDVETGGLLTFTNNDKQGVINLKQEVILKPEWYYIALYKNEIYATKHVSPKLKLRMLLHNDGKPVFTDTVAVLANVELEDRRVHRVAFSLKDSVSYIYFGDSGKVLTLDYFAHSYLFLGEGASAIMVINGKRYEKDQLTHTSMISMSGEALLPSEYDYICGLYTDEINPSRTLFRIGKQNLEGIYSAVQKRWIWPPSPVKISKDYNFPLFTLQSDDGKTRYVDENGTLIVSERVKVTGNVREYLNFRVNKKDYYLKYDSEECKFYWYRGYKNK